MPSVPFGLSKCIQEEYFKKEVFWLPVCKLPVVRFMALFLLLNLVLKKVLMHRKIARTLNVNVILLRFFPQPCVQFNTMSNTHPTFSGVNVILIQIPRHPKICHLTLFSFTNKNISRCQITMYNLEKKNTVHLCIVSEQDVRRRSFNVKKEVTFLEGGGGD